MAEKVKAEIIEADIDIAKLVDVEVVQNALVAATEAIEKADRKIELFDAADLSLAKNKELRTVRADLNASIKEIADWRKKVKAELLKPYNVVDAAIKERTEGLKALEERYADQIRANDARDKAAREEHMREVFEGFAGELATVIDYERIANPKWLNAAGWTDDEEFGLSNRKAEEELYDRMGKVIADYETMCDIAGTFFDFESAKVLFFECLDLNAVRAADKEKRERQEAIEAMEQRVEENRAALQGYEPDMGDEENLPPEEWRTEDQPATRTWRITVALTDAEKSELIGWFKQRGISGRMKEVRDE